MEHENKPISRKSIIFVGVMTALAVVIFMTAALCFIDNRADSLVNEVLMSVKDAIRAEARAADAQSIQYVHDVAAVAEHVFSEKVIMYEVREYNGKIAVLTTSDGSIAQILDVYVFMLPETDKAELTSGIPLYSDTELLSIIQDYTS
jgi:hypothetical protein